MTITYFTDGKSEMPYNCKEKQREYYQNNKERIQEYRKNYKKNNLKKIREMEKKYRENNKDKIKEYRENNKEKQREWYQNNKEKILEWERIYKQKYRKKHREKVLKQAKKYRENNKEKIREYLKVYTKKRYATDPCFKLRHSISARVGKEMRKYLTTKKESSINYLGCSMKKLKEHLESKFDTNMTWDNWSIHGWHIDHIIPSSSFDLTKEEEQKKCFHYTNLQPLWAKDNMAKSNKLNWTKEKEE